MDMNQRESTDGCFNCEGVPTDGCSQLYVGDIEIRLENVAAIQSSHKHEYEYLVTYNEEPRSNSPSPLELRKLIKSSRKKKRRSSLMNHPSLKAL